MNPPNTIATDTLVEAIARGIAEAKGIEICADASYRHSTFGPLAQAALTAITEAGYAVVGQDRLNLAHDQLRWARAALDGGYRSERAKQEIAKIDEYFAAIKGETK